VKFPRCDRRRVRRGRAVKIRCRHRSATDRARTDRAHTAGKDCLYSVAFQHSEKARGASAVRYRHCSFPNNYHSAPIRCPRGASCTVWPVLSDLGSSGLCTVSGYLQWPRRKNHPHYSVGTCRTFTRFPNFFRTRGHQDRPIGQRLSARTSLSLGSTALWSRKFFS